MINNNLRIFISIILFFVFTTTFAFEVADVDAAWKARGYMITTKSDYKIVEFKFNYENMVTLDLSGKELIIYTMIDSELTSPTEKYISDIENIFKNSGFDIEPTASLLTALADKNYSFGKESVVENNYLLKTQVYQKNNIILQFKFVVEATDISEKIDIEENKLLKELAEKLKTENSKLKTENSSLKAESESMARTIERLEAKANGLQETLDKYQNLSDYKETVTENLQRTIERYKEIERQKLEEIELKTSIIEDLNDKIAEMAFEAKQKDFKMNGQIEGLKNEIKALEEEKTLLMESENHYKSRLYMINSLYNLVITESEIPVSVPESGVAAEVITPEQFVEENTVTDKNNSMDMSGDTDHTKPVEIKSETELPQKTEEIIEITVPSEEKRLKMIKGYNNETVTHQVEYTYDEDGKLIKETVSLPSGQIVNVVESKYYENGKLYEKSTYENYENSKFVGKGVYQYNKDGQPSRIFIYDADSITGYQVFEYDNNLSEETPLTIKNYEDNQLKMIETNTFDEAGNIIRTEQRDADNQLISFRIFEIENTLPVRSVYYQGTEKKAYTLNKFDEAGNILSQKTFDTEDKLLSSVEFIYE